MKEEMVLFDATRAGVAVITLNRPEIHNAFNALVIERLHDIFEELRGADGVRVVLIEGAGKSFSAGGDLAWMKAAANYSHTDNLKDGRGLADMLYQLYTLPQPTIALVHGAARGGGVGLVSACDMAIATEKANFALSEVKLGLTPATISPYVLKAIGERSARRYMLTAEVFDAQTARELGLVHEVVADRDALAAKSEELVQAIFQVSPGAAHAAKDLIEHVADRPVDKSLRDETSKRIADQRSTPEGQEGLSAFLEKRKPNWIK